ncbi:hypothetical protein ACFS07_08145 [Undibacterium arcticum]
MQLTFGIEGGEIYATLEWVLAHARRIGLTLLELKNAAAYARRATYRCRDACGGASSRTAEPVRGAPGKMVST